MNKIFRNILQVRFDINHIPVMSTNVMYKTLNILKFRDVYSYFLLKFIHKAYYENFDLFRDNFLALLPNNTYNTRNSRINLPVVRTNVEKSSTIYQSCKLIRSLPEYLLLPQSSHLMKVKFKDFVLSSY